MTTNKAQAASTRTRGRIRENTSSKSSTVGSGQNLPARAAAAGYTQEEIKTIASDAGFTVPGDLFETGKRQKQA